MSLLKNELQSKIHSGNHLIVLRKEFDSKLSQISPKTDSNKFLRILVKHPIRIVLLTDLECSCTTIYLVMIFATNFEVKRKNANFQSCIRKCFNNI